MNKITPHFAASQDAENADTRRRLLKFADGELDFAKANGNAALIALGSTGFEPTRYTVHVNGPWCITFEFDGEDAARVDFEQYH
ncbi:type II toxin-antitoxin system RelE/ParE family toxin [Mesorhizobium hawassense]|uniref:type II toxin-antitoxin system RelE/ParE family toxin n=1 Tax=Mesorhizobium hawassense TaxID=1209954 RepID=UPI001FE1953D|nr:type II toxin-antitoxin system RelE/ParE family toxin [Mesorhizobium hawassense]